MERVSIADIGAHVDREVEIRGWLYNMRSKGKIAFLQLRDGTGRIQGVAEESGCGGCARSCSSCAAMAGGYSGSKPWASMVRRAAALRSK